MISFSGSFGGPSRVQMSSEFDLSSLKQQYTSSKFVIFGFNPPLFKKSQTLQSELLRSLLNCISAPVFCFKLKPSNLFLYLKHCISSDFSNHKFNDFALKAFDRLSVFFILNQTMSYQLSNVCHSELIFVGFFLVIIEILLVFDLDLSNKIEL